MTKHVYIFIVGIILAGCSSTEPVTNVSKWIDLSSTYPSGSISWHAPESVTQTRFTQHIKQLGEQTSLNKKSRDVLWWKGYDVSSWGYPTFLMEIAVAKYTQPYSNIPSIDTFRKDQLKLWSGTAHAMDEVVLGGQRWLRITADYSDELNACRRVQFQVPLTCDFFLNVMAEYDKEARKDVEWLTSRMAVMSNVVESIRITRQ